MGLPLPRTVPVAGLALIVAGAAGLTLFLLAGCAPADAESEVLPVVTATMVPETLAPQPQTATPAPATSADSISGGAEAETATFALG